MKCAPVVEMADIQRAYPVLAEGCLRVATREGQPFFAPALYAEVMAGRWAQFMVYDDQGEPVGVFVCRAQADSRTGQSVMFVLLAYVLPGHGPEALGAGFAACKQYAAQCQCSKVQFASKRVGWARRAQQLGYRPAQQLYELEVQP
jgi:hypothetical protein